MNRITDRCKNITLPQTSFAGGKNRIRKAGPVCNLNVIYSSFDIKLTDGQFSAGINGSSDWIHITMNYIGPEHGQGIVIYQNGQEVAADTQKYLIMGQPGDGMLVAGRMLTKTDNSYSTFNLDELLFFNSVLNEEEVNAIYRL